MSTVAEVRLWGRRIGAVALGDDDRVATFEYDPEFRQSGIEVAPLVMPLEDRLYAFPGLPAQSFHGLPGLLADSLPDRFGNTLINAWLATQGRTPDSFNAIERLCYIGKRGMGALEFAPLKGPRATTAHAIDIGNLVELASEILNSRGALSESLARSEREESLRNILRIGTSAGGARAKAVIAWNRTTNEVRSGQVTPDPGFEHWLLKFDGVSGNRDKELNDPLGYGAVEYAYHKMAVDAGITMTECRLLHENDRRHFMTRRYDRLPNGSKLHAQSLAAIAHFDFNSAGAHSYEQAFLVIRQLRLPMSATEELFRRMVFNVVARNQDDHVKNISFLMDKAGRWSLAPAYDVTYSYNPHGAWTSSHQMSINGKRDSFTLDDLRTCAATALMKRGRAETITSEVTNAVRAWAQYADEVGVARDYRDNIAQAHRLNIV